MRTASRLVAAASALVLAGTLAACGNDENGEGNGEQEVPETITATAAPEEDPAGAGARDALHDVDCRVGDDNQWFFFARLHNAQPEPKLYTITANVAQIEGGNVVGSATQEHVLEPDQWMDVLMPQLHGEPGEGLHCTNSAHVRNP